LYNKAIATLYVGELITIEVNISLKLCALINVKKGNKGLLGYWNKDVEKDERARGNLYVE